MQPQQPARKHQAHCACINDAAGFLLTSGFGSMEEMSLSIRRQGWRRFAYRHAVRRQWFVVAIRIVRKRIVARIDFRIADAVIGNRGGRRCVWIGRHGHMGV